MFALIVFQALIRNLKKNSVLQHMRYAYIEISVMYAVIPALIYWLVLYFHDSYVKLGVVLNADTMETN